MSYPYFPPPPGQPGVPPPRAVSPATHYSQPPPPTTSSHAPYNPAEHHQSLPTGGYNIQAPGAYSSPSRVSHSTTHYPPPPATSHGFHAGNWRTQLAQLATQATQSYNESLASMQAIARAAQNQSSHHMNQYQSMSYSAAPSNARQNAPPANYNHAAPVYQAQAASPPVPSSGSAQVGGYGAMHYRFADQRAQHQTPGVSSASNSSYPLASSLTRPSQAQGKVEEAADRITGDVEPARAYPWMQTLSFRPASQALASETLNSGDFAAPPEQKTVPAPDVDHLSSKMDKASIQSDVPPGIEPPQLQDEDLHERPVGKPRMTLDGEPNDVLWTCPAPKAIDYESVWYCLPDNPDFLICTHCRHEYLAETGLSSLLERTRRPTGRCRFNVPRLTRALLPAYRKSGDLEPIRDFMKRRLSVQDCHGEAGVNGLAGVVWYKPLDARLSGMISCEACYEDVILVTSFRGKWGLHDRAHRDEFYETWVCDISLQFIRRISEKLPVLPGRTWEDWVRSAANHKNRPTCQWDDDNVPSSSRRWVRLRGGSVPSIRICERCYEEQVALTALDHEFEFIPPGDGALHGPDPSSCSMRYLPVLLAGAVAKTLGESGSFVQSAELIAANPRCTRDGIAHGTWYTLAGGDVRDDFKICAACYAAFFGALGLGRFFEQVTGADGSSQSAPVACNFHTTAPRWRQQYDLVQEALQTGVWPRFSDWVRKFAGVPVCARDEEVDGRRWYGWDECTICPECWVGFCADSSSSSPGLAVELRNQDVVGRRMCCMYSPLMRRKWLAACERGSADELVEYARARRRVFVEVMPRIRMLRSQHQTQQMQSISAGQTSTMYARLAMHSNSGNLSGMGYYSPYSYSRDNYLGAQSAAYLNQMQVENSQSSTTRSMIQDLLNQWKAVE